MELGQQRRDDPAAEADRRRDAQVAARRAAAQFSKNSSPSAVSVVLRVVRRNSRVSSWVSSFCTLRLTAERPMPRRSAARAKLPSWTTAMKATTPA
jgi:hypothetical protein